MTGSWGKVMEISTGFYGVVSRCVRALGPFSSASCVRPGRDLCNGCVDWGSDVANVREGGRGSDVAIFGVLR